MAKREHLLKYEGYIFDLDGTVYLSNRLLANADQVIAPARNGEKGFVLIKQAH